MKKFYLLIVIAGYLALAAILYHGFFGRPLAFRERGLDESSLVHLSSSEALRGSPEEVADEYLYGLLHPGDRPDRGALEISVSQPNAVEAVVTVINRHTYDDSISASCDRVTLRLQNSLWAPVRHQEAWQGRGLFGWSTQLAK